MNNENKKSGMARLWQLAFTKKALAISSAVFSVTSTVISFVPFISIYFIIQELVLNMDNPAAVDSGYIIKLGWLAGGGAIAAVFLNFIALMCSHMAAFQTLYLLKLEFSRHIASLPLGFHTANSTGKLRKIVDENIEKIEGFIAHQFPDMVGSFATPVVAIVVLFLFDWRMGLGCIIPLIVLFIIQGIAMGGKKSRIFIKQYQDALESMNNAAVEYVRGVSVVKAFNQTIFSFRKFYETIKNYGDWALAYTKSFKAPYVLFMAILHNIYIFLIPLIIWLAGGVTDYTGFALSAIFYLIFSLALPGSFLKILYVSQMGKQIADGVERMDKVLDEAPLKETTSPQKTNSYSISFQEVSFSYQGLSIEDEANNTEALSEISFAAKQGEITALVGPSGSGKSTIAHLIPRFYDVASGSIKIGGIDIRDMDSDYLMSIVSFVFQDVFLFKQSILDNIRIGNKNAGREEIIAAAKAAQCHEFIEKLPNGYDTVIGTKNVHLSGGERQRLVIARAILRDAPIIVLDEATAFADPENEQKIQIAFERLMKNKTVIIIAHRLSTVRGANKIIVIDNGKKAEEGRHNELVLAGGRYSRMWTQYAGAANWTIGANKKEV